MATEKLKDLMVQLHEELERESALAMADRTMLQQLHTDIHSLLEENPPLPPTQSLGDRVKQLEIRFASAYPNTERVFQEILEEIHMIGI